jgi:hypothetical protein
MGCSRIALAHSGNASVARILLQCNIEPRATPARAALLVPLKRGDLRMNHHRALALCLRMIFSENRFTLFRIMR